MKDATDRLVQRTVRITKRQPAPPRELIFDETTNLLTWQPPQDTRMVTHFRVRIGSDSDVPTYQPAVGQTTLQLTSGITRVFITSYNQVADLESSPAMLDLTPMVPGPPPDGDTGPPVTAVINAQEVGARFTDSLRRVHVTIAFTPVVQTPRVVTYLLSTDSGATWSWVGFQQVDTAGQVIKMDWFAIPDDADWQVACIAGNPGGDIAPISNAAMLAKYPGIVTSNLFPVLGLPKPKPSQGIKATVGVCSNVVTSDGLTQYGSIPGVIYTDPTASLDFFVRITVQDLNASQAAIDKEKPHGGTQITGGSHTEKELLVTYTPGLAFIRYRFYIANRESQGDGDFANTDTNTIQMVEWNKNPVLADHYDVPVVIPPFTPVDPSDVFNVLNVVAREVGPRYQDDKSQLHTVVGLAPILDVNFDKPHTVTFWLDFGDGKPVWQDSYEISFAGQEVKLGEQTLGSDGTRKSGKIWAPLNAAQGNWKAWCAPGHRDQNVSPVGFPVCPFHVSPAIACSPNGVTDARFALDPATNDLMTYYRNDVGVWHWEYYKLEWTPPTQDADINFWQTLITVQKGATIAGVWTPAPDAEGANADPFLNFLGRVHEKIITTPGLAHDQTTFMERKGAWPSTWDVPPDKNKDGTDNIYREFRFLIYSVSRLGTDSSGSGGAGTYTLQTTCWPGGASFFILTPTPKYGDLDLRYTNPATITGPLSGGGGMPITINPGDITGTYLPDDSILARHMAEDSITAANKALAANSVADGNIKDVGVVKLIYGTNVFTGDVILSRGKSLPVVVISNTGLNLFGQANAADGKDGLLTKPNISIQSGGMGLFSGEVSAGVVGAAATLTSSAITFWTKNGLTTAPYVTVSAGGIVMSDGSASPGPNTFTLNSAGFDLFESGGTHITAQSGVFQIIKPRPTPATQGNNVFKVDAGGLTFFTGIVGNANYTSLLMDANGMKVAKGAAAETNVAMTANAITIVASATGASVALTSDTLTMMNSNNVNGPMAKLSAAGLEFTNGGASGASVTITSSKVTIVKGSLTAADINGGSLNITTGGGTGFVLINNTTAGVQVSSNDGTQLSRLSSNVITVQLSGGGSSTLSPISLLVGQPTPPAANTSCGFTASPGGGLYLAGVLRAGFDGVWLGGVQCSDHIFGNDFGISTISLGWPQTAAGGTPVPPGGYGPGAAQKAVQTFRTGDGRTAYVSGGIILNIV